MLAGTTTLLALSGCQKQYKNDSSASQNPEKQKIELPEKTNPYSLRNVQKALKTLNRSATPNRSGTSTSSSSAARAPIETNGTVQLPQYVYFQFDPNNIQTEEYQLLEKDSTVTLLDFPFANLELYSEEFALDEDKKEQLTDGTIYGITSIDNSEVMGMLQGSGTLGTHFLDTLVLIPEEDTALQYQTLREAGYNED